MLDKKIILYMRNKKLYTEISFIFSNVARQAIFICVTELYSILESSSSKGYSTFWIIILIDNTRYYVELSANNLAYEY